jgi:hypothetical protein
MSATGDTNDRAPPRKDPNMTVSSPRGGKPATAQPSRKVNRPEAPKPPAHGKIPDGVQAGIPLEKPQPDAGDGDD